MSLLSSAFYFGEVYVATFKCVKTILKQSFNEDYIRKFKNKLQKNDCKNVLNQQKENSTNNLFLNKFFSVYNKNFLRTDHKIKQKLLLRLWIRKVFSK